MPVELKNLPVAKRFGIYALILARERQFLGTVTWVSVPCADGMIENVP